ncbi:zinc ABC transporter substrate-binding protein [Planococcus antarcticus DSM 14505]|uniref:Zinc ABC transporter substrate-binding protein n=1 Tax=Planococcus antarcticus DSM 14505 TaxID=1185653 RepID=A0ABM6DCM8_9BACL|nr:zinc ABC transporter substrate-binding protein [Planococcus antarcticus DSM 14505]
MAKVKTSMVLILSCILALAGCNSNQNESSGQNEDSSASDDQLKIVTTFFPMYEFTRNITQDKANVELLVPSNVEPHDWKPTPKDMAMIQEADVVIYNSTYMETWITSIQDSLDENQPLFVEASQGIDLMEGAAHEHDHEEVYGHGEEEGHHEEYHEYGEEGDHHEEEEVHHEHGGEQLDPHVWLSPVLAQEEVKTITDAIVKLDPENQRYYESRSEEYTQELKELDELFHKTLKDISGKEIITQHAAFGYLAREYDLVQVPIAGLSPSQEPSPAKLAELKDFAEEKEINVIYFGETTSPKVAETLATEIGAETEVLSTLEGLSQEDKEAGLGYIDIMKNNLTSLEKSLKK